MWRKKRVGVLFVCANNICRSPLAEGAFRAMAKRQGILRDLVIDSRGTLAGFVGQRADPRALRAAASRGYDLSRIRARQLTAKDFDRFQWILAMDEANLRAVAALQPTGFAGHAGLLMDMLPGAPAREIPDPYFGGIALFEQALDLAEPACEMLAAQVARELAERR